jgi:hypothetical protein
MRIYRLTILGDGGSSFHGTKEEAMAEFKAVEKAGLLSKVELLEFTTDKATLVAAFNLVLCHPDHWPGERITKIRQGATKC